jgi:hypothetical protein
MQGGDEAPALAKRLTMEFAGLDAPEMTQSQALPAPNTAGRPTPGTRFPALIPGLT